MPLVYSVFHDKNVGMLAILICFIKHGVENNISCQRETRLRGIGDKQCFNYTLFFTRLGTMAI
jgi:hypothetical protein